MYPFLIPECVMLASIQQNGIKLAVRAPFISCRYASGLLLLYVNPLCLSCPCSLANRRLCCSDSLVTARSYTKAVNALVILLTKHAPAQAVRSLREADTVEDAQVRSSPLYHPNICQAAERVSAQRQSHPSTLAQRLGKHARSLGELS